LLWILGLFALLGCEAPPETEVDSSEVVVPPGLVIVPHPEWATPTLVWPHTTRAIWNSVRIEAEGRNGTTGMLFKTPTGRWLFDTTRPFSVRFDTTRLPNGPAQVSAWATEADPEYHFNSEGGVTQHFSHGVGWRFDVSNALHPDNPCPHNFRSAPHECGGRKNQHLDEILSHDAVDLSYIIEGPVSDTTVRTRRHTDFGAGQSKFVLSVPGDGLIAAVRADVRGSAASHDHGVVATLKSPRGVEVPLDIQTTNFTSLFKTDPKRRIHGFLGESAKGKWTLKVQTPQGGRLTHFSLRFVTDCVFEP